MWREAVHICDGTVDVNANQTKGETVAGPRRQKGAAEKWSCHHSRRRISSTFFELDHALMLKRRPAGGLIARKSLVQQANKVERGRDASTAPLHHHHHHHPCRSRSNTSCVPRICPIEYSTGLLLKQAANCPLRIIVLTFEYA